METATPKKVHHGRNVRHWRKERDLTQRELGEMIDKSQQFINDLEKKEEIPADTMQQVADALEVPIEAITDFVKEPRSNYITNKVEITNDTGENKIEYSAINPTYYYQYYNCTFIPRGDDERINQILKSIENKDIK